MNCVILVRLLVHTFTEEVFYRATVHVPGDSPHCRTTTEGGGAGSDPAVWISDPVSITLTFTTLYNTFNTLTQPETHSAQVVGAGSGPTPPHGLCVMQRGVLLLPIAIV